jgi:preprotein translocase subunit SecA
VSITIDEVLSEAGSKGSLRVKALKEEVLSDARIAYQRREDQLGSPAMRELERRVVLSVIDRRWRDHLYEMDYLKDGIGLRAMAQRDPLVEYQREGFSLYQSMMEAIREETVGFLYNLEVEVTSGDGQARVAAKGLGASTAPQQGLSYSAPSDDVSGGVEVRNQRGQVERAATARAQQAAARQAQAQAQQGGGERGAFGQRVDGDGAGQQAPLNRAQRRAQERRGR